MTWPLVVYFAFVVVLVAAVIGLSYLLGSRHLEPATGEPYEGGIVQAARDPMIIALHSSATADTILAALRAGVHATSFICGH